MANIVSSLSSRVHLQVDGNTGTRLVAYPHGINLVHQETLGASEDNVFDLDLTENSNVVRNDTGRCLSSLKPPLVITPHTRCAVDSFRAWLDDPRAQQSFLLVGPEGCGKR